MNPLDQLNDIVLPEPIGWWPLALGWWLLIAAALILTMSSISIFLINKKRTAYRRDGVNQLRLLYKKSSTLSDSQYAFHLLALIKNTVLASAPFQTANNGSIKSAVTYYDATHFSKALTASFPKNRKKSNKLVQHFDNYYHPTFTVDKHESYTDTLDWIKQHDAKALMSAFSKRTDIVEPIAPAPTEALSS